jgi:predicted MFS family arabinose efflux permease
MSLRQLKIGYLALTWLNIYAVAYYFNYLFFHLRQDFGFGNRENLWFAALNGLIYVPASWYGGRFTQRHGSFAALKVGFVALAVLLGLGAFLEGLRAQTWIMALWTIAICFTWVPLETLASEKESRAGLAHMVGIYNVVWSGGAAVAYFTGGTLQQALGKTSLYWLPALLHGVQLVLLLWLEKKSRGIVRVAHHSTEPIVPGGNSPEPDFAQHHISPATAKSFLRMAWLANPFAYVAMSTVIPLIPELAARFGLSTAMAGFVASVWMFARLAAFALLWRWTAWHYRFGWLLASYVVMLASFLALLLGPNLLVIVAAQIAFGLAVGLIYYSSLFYAMDVGGETQGEHGGIHEALIGLGIFGGPVVGAAALQLVPTASHAGIWAVGALLITGLPGLFWLRRGQSMVSTDPLRKAH